MSVWASRLLWLIFMGLSVLLLHHTLKDYRLALASLRWPATPGKVFNTEVSEHRIRDRESGMLKRYYTTKVRYRYRVKGTTHQHWRVSAPMKKYTTRASAEKAIRKYTPGSTVRVRYRPQNPQTALIESVDISRFGIPVWIGVGLFLLTTIMLITGVQFRSGERGAGRYR